MSSAARAGRFVNAAVACALLANCSPARDNSARDTVAVTTDSVGHRGVSSPVQPNDSLTVPPQRPASAWTVTTYGIGALRAGMSIKDATDSLNGALVLPSRANLSECNYASWRGAPAGVLVMTNGGRIARVDVNSAGVTTLEGAGVGSSEAQLKSLYAGRFTISPHKYTDGHYVTVKAVNPADSLYRMIFETDKGTVTRFRAGILPEVEYVEGCS